MKGLSETWWIVPSVSLLPIGAVLLAIRKSKIQWSMRPCWESRQLRSIWLRTVYSNPNKKGDKAMSNHNHTGSIWNNVTDGARRHTGPGTDYEVKDTLPA